MGLGQHVGGPVETAMGKPCGGEPFAAVDLDKLGDHALVGLGRGSSECERHVAQAQLEQAIAPA